MHTTYLSLILEDVRWQWLIVEVDGGDMMSSSLNLVEFDIGDTNLGLF